MNQVKRVVNFLGVSCLVVTGFLLLLIVSASPLGINPGMTYSDCLVRISMNGFPVPAMMVPIICGAGLNFGLPIGTFYGLLGSSVAVQFNWSGLAGLWSACIVSVPFVLVTGYFYAVLLNNVKGSEMTAGNYMAFSIVSLVSTTWLVPPYNNSKIVWLITGVGLHTTVALEDNYDKVLNDFLCIDFKQMGVLQNGPHWRDFSVSAGFLLAFAVGCLPMWLLMRAKAGIIMRCSGVNPGFFRAPGMNNSRVRTIGTVVSVVIAATGTDICSQSYGFYQSYSAPLIMAFPAMAAILIGGATPRKASIFNAVLDVILFQCLLTLTTLVANAVINVGSISGVVCIIVQNGIILYASTEIKTNGEK